MTKLLQTIVSLLHDLLSLSKSDNVQLANINSELQELNGSVNETNVLLNEVLTELQQIKEAIAPGPPASLAISFGIPTNN